MNKLILAFALIAPIFSAPAFAADTTPAVAVPYHDLRLSSQDGRAALDRRLSHAVETVCAVDPSIADAREKRAAEACVAAKEAEVAPLRAAALASQGISVRVASAQR